MHLCVCYRCLSQGIDAINQSKVVELLKDGGSGGGDRRHSREGVNGPGGQRGESEGDDSAEWNGVSATIFSGTWTQLSFEGQSSTSHDAFISYLELDHLDHNI